MPFVPAIIGAVISGVTAAAGAVGAAGSAIAAGATGLAEGIGIPAAIAGPLGTGAEMAIGQGALGAGEAALTGGDPLKGLEAGAISGFTGGAGGGILGGLGLDSTLATTAANAAGGAAGNAATGGNPLTGAIQGGASGLLASSLSHGGLTPPAAGAPAAGGAAPSSVPLAPATSGQLDTSGVSLDSAGSGGLTNNLPGAVGTGAAGGSAGSLPGDISGSGGGFAIPGAGDTVSATGAAPSPITSGTGLSVGGATAGGGGSGFLNTLNKNPGLATAGIGLLGDVIKGNQMAPAERQLQTNANRLGAQGQLDESYLRSGLLPPGQQAALTAQGTAAKAAINSMYASRGTPGSSANVEDIANEGLRQQAVAGDLAMQLYKSGIQETGMSDQVLQELLNVQLGEDNDLSAAIAKMSTSLASMGQPIQAGAGA